MVPPYRPPTTRDGDATNQSLISVKSSPVDGYTTFPDPWARTETDLTESLSGDRDSDSLSRTRTVHGSRIRQGSEYGGRGPGGG